MAGGRAVFVDGSGLLFRAWHALPRTLRTADGRPTNALYGFARMFRKVLAGRRPTHGAVVFDAPGGRAERVALDPAYKAHRPAMDEDLRAQVPHLAPLIRAHGFPVLQVEGVEADDVLATLTTAALGAGADVWVVSGDKDLLQLVGERVRVWDGVKEVLYDAEAVYRRFGVPPERLPDLQGLAGDRVDGIPAVPGVGPKTAAALLAAHGSLEGVLAAEVPGRVGAALAAHRDQALRSRALATLRRDAPLPVGLDGLAVTFPSPEDLDRIYLQHEFYSLLAPGAVPKRAPVQYFVCDTPALARAALAAETTGPEPVALHVLWDLPDPLRGALVGVALSPALGRAVYLPLAGDGSSLGPEGLALLRPWLEDPARPKVAHDAKGAIVALARHGVTLRGVVGDPGLASYLVDPTKHLPHRLEQVAREYLHVGLQPIRGVLGSGRDLRTFSELSVDRAGAWACHQADAAGACWRALAPRIRAEGLSDLLFGLDLPLAEVLAGMERTGIAMDPEVLTREGARLKAERAALRATLQARVGRPFNPGSHKQVGAVLFEDLKLPVLKHTATGWSVDAEVLDQLADLHPAVGELLRWRAVDKLISTYTEVLLAAIGPDGRIHPTFQQTVSASGRLITTEPDLQRTPVRTDELRALREAFVAPPGSVLLSADWSQIELRILAHVSGDEALCAAFRDGRDVHAATAAGLFGVAPSEVDRRQREIGKTVNFATLYGQGAAALARQLRIPVVEARRYVEAFFARYAGVARWREVVVERARVDGYVSTLLGRRRYLPELSSRDPNDRAYGERVAVNSPIQGSAADLCKRAMLDVARALADRGLRARMVLQIHDELLLEVPEDELAEVGPLVRERMASALPLSVPLVVDLAIGRSWAET